MHRPLRAQHRVDIVTPHATQPRDCIHGQLARSCQRCDDARDIAGLTAELAELRRLHEILVRVVKQTTTAVLNQFDHLGNTLLTMEMKREDRP